VQVKALIIGALAMLMVSPAFAKTEPQATPERLAAAIAYCTSAGGAVAIAGVAVTGAGLFPAAIAALLCGVLVDDLDRQYGTGLPGLE
jgi:hypothetical protein